MKFVLVVMIAFGAIPIFGQAPTPSPPIRIAVVDSGVDAKDPVIMKMLWTNPKEIVGNDIDDDEDGCIDDIHGCNMFNVTGQPDDDHGHGTFIASILAGNSEPSLWRTEEQKRGAEIIPVRAMAKTFLKASNGEIKEISVEGSVESLTAGIGYIIRLHELYGGRFILSLSWSRPDGQQIEKISELLRNASDSGILIVVAAGNEGNVNKLGFPANLRLKNMISVGAMQGEKVADFSSSGADIAAQGANIKAAWRGQSIQSKSGTSFAVAMVDEAAVMIWEKHPNYTAEQVKKILFDSADHIKAFRFMFREGRVLNLDKALAK